jgi:hypothetical protein
VLSIGHRWTGAAEGIPAFETDVPGTGAGQTCQHRPGHVVDPRGRPCR